MARKQSFTKELDAKVVLRAHVVMGVIGLAFVWMGIATIGDAVYRLVGAGDWRTGTFLVVFGSMILGVSISKIVELRLGGKK